MNKVNDQPSERESEPITADVTGSMQRGLRYDPAITGPAVSVDERGVSLDPDGIPNPWRGIAEERRAAKARPEPGSWVTVTIPRAIVSDRHVQDKHLWLFVGSDNDALYIPFVAIDSGSVEVRPADEPTADVDALRTTVRRIIRSRDAGQISAEDATEQILAATGRTGATA